MGENTEANGESIQVRKLTTLAMLKTEVDRGRTFGEMVRPFIVEAIRQRSQADFSSNEIQLDVEKRFGLAIPEHIVKIALSGCVRDELVKKEGGRYFRLQANMNSEFSRPLDEVQREQADFIEMLAAYLSSRFGQDIPPERAETILLTAFDTNSIEMVLDSSWSDGFQQALDHSEMVALAEFIRDEMENAQFIEILQGVIAGLVLQDSLTLSQITFSDRPFRRMRVFLDTTFLLSLLGLEGKPSANLARESVHLLRKAGATLCVFVATVEEIRGILRLYADRLATPEGRSTLRQTALTRYVLTQKLTSSEIRQRIARLEQDLRQYVRIEEFPRSDRRFAIDEKGLSEFLASNEDSLDDPRVIHDVDCIAAVMTLRGRSRPSKLEEVNAIFATNTRLIITNTQKWFQHSYGREIAPAISVSKLVREAWRRNPSLGMSLPRVEMAAVCNAALRPPRAAWEIFQTHLRRLVNEGTVSSDEEVAILASELTDQLLSENYGEQEPDAECVLEALDRVKTNLKRELEQEYQEKLNREHAASKEMDQKIKALEENLAHLADEVKRSRARSDNAAGLTVNILMGVIRFVMFVFVSAIFVFSAVTLSKGISPSLRFAIYCATGVVVLLSAYGEVFDRPLIGRLLGRIRESVKIWVQSRITK